MFLACHKSKVTIKLKFYYSNTMVNSVSFVSTGTFKRISLITHAYPFVF
jgi:hypothetical protein